MRAHWTGALVAAFALAGCGGSTPTAPSTTQQPGVSASAAQSIIGATVTQATGLVAGAASGGLSNVMTRACPAGGSMTMTFDVTIPTGPTNTMTTSSRTEFNDCRSQSVTINGDPYLTMTGEHTFGPVVDGIPSTITGTLRMTGGLRFDAAGTPGRAQYNCTQVVTIQFSGGTPQPATITSSGTITWEQPLGTVIVRPCGP